ncbi:MAG: GntR family transcriptional regulator [Candidatus Nanopelagicales bacterium]|nr:GntR family transcriptional regulator [Candidatus Nanopelagicales bacterium]
MSVKTLPTQEEVLTQLRVEILTGRLQPGQQIVQDALAEKFGVSRVPLREALKILEGEGQVTHHLHRGYFVAELSITDLHEVYRLRALLEREAVTAAVANITDRDLLAIAELATQVRKATATGEVLAITAANREFHFAIFELSEMPRLVRLLRQLWDSTDVYRSVYFAQAPNRERILLEHDEILNALSARNVARTVRWHDTHRDNSVATVSAVISS